jgi:hypothetical protein
MKGWREVLLLLSLLKFSHTWPTLIVYCHVLLFEGEDWPCRVLLIGFSILNRMIHFWNIMITDGFSFFAMLEGHIWSICASVLSKLPLFSLYMWLIHTNSKTLRLRSYSEWLESSWGTDIVLGPTGWAQHSRILILSSRKNWKIKKPQHAQVQL